MERLTERDGQFVKIKKQLGTYNGAAVGLMDGVVAKLARYEDEEEQGRLIRLPDDAYDAALQYWLNRYNVSKDYDDLQWECGEAREHREYVEMLKCAVVALATLARKEATGVTISAPPHAEWKKIGYGRLSDDGYEIKYRCSACGFVVTEQPTEPENYILDNFNACPKCFADMRAVQT